LLEAKITWVITIVNFQRSHGVGAVKNVLVEVIFQNDVELSILDFVSFKIFVHLNANFSLFFISLHCHHHADRLVVFLGSSNIVNCLDKESEVLIGCFLDNNGNLVAFTHKVARLFETNKLARTLFLSLG
jgi:hypothetical protein